MGSCQSQCRFYGFTQDEHDIEPLTDEERAADVDQLFDLLSYDLMVDGPLQPLTDEERAAGVDELFDLPEFDVAQTDDLTPSTVCSEKDVAQLEAVASVASAAVAAATAIIATPKLVTTFATKPTYRTAKPAMKNRLPPPPPPRLKFPLVPFSPSNTYAPPNGVRRLPRVSREVARANRRRAIETFRQKKRENRINYSRGVRFPKRQNVAKSRPRVNGKFKAVASTFVSLDQI